MTKKCSTFLLAAAGVAVTTQIHAQNTIIADWTFETTTPTTAGPVSPEIGAGSASGSHTGAATFSSPAGNGSSHSYSANTWAIGDFWQFQVSTVGLSGIHLNYDQTSSNTGPGVWQLEWSTDGTTFNNFGSTYTVLANASPNTAWNAGNNSGAYSFSDDLSSITALDNQSSVFFRIVDVSNTGANGSPVAGSGTDRIDNMIVGVPEPSSIALMGLGGLASIYFAKRRRK